MIMVLLQHQFDNIIIGNSAKNQKLLFGNIVLIYIWQTNQ